MKFNVYITIVNENKEPKKLSLAVTFFKSDSGYGNDTYMNVASTSGREFRQSYDIRYEKDYDKRTPEIYIAKWAYNYWSGEHGSWDIKELKIVRDDRCSKQCK